MLVIQEIQNGKILSFYYKILTVYNSKIVIHVGTYLQLYYYRCWYVRIKRNSMNIFYF